MKMQQESQNVVVNGSFETSEFATGDISFLVDMMSDYIYTNKERAILREISVNGHDAQVRAGTEHIPIEVRIPTVLDNTVSFRDSGAGLSDAGIRGTFCGIGISDKRDSDTETGCFGVGTLSPYSLCDSFSVTSYHGDTVIDYLCYRDENRRPQVSELTRRERNKDDHDDRTGLLISMTVKDKVKEFRKEAAHVYKHWRGTTVDLSAQNVLEDIEAANKKIIIENDDCMISSSGDSDDFMSAFQGNICYEIPSFDWSSVGEDLPVTAYQCERFLRCFGLLKFCVKEDALSFDVSREKLENKPENMLKIKKKMAKVIAQLNKNVIKLIEEGETPLDRAKKAWNLGCGELGRIVKQDKEMDAVLRKYELKTEEPHTVWSSRYRGSDKSERTTVELEGGRVKVKYALAKPRMTTRIKNYLKDKRTGESIVIFNDKEQQQQAQIPDSELFDLEDLPKVVRSSSRGISSSGNVYSTYKTFEVDKTQTGWNEKNYFKECELSVEEGSTEPIYYVEINRYEIVRQVYGDGRNDAQVLGKILRQAESQGYDVPKVYALKSSFLNSRKFKKHKFVPLTEWIKNVVLPDLPESKRLPCEYHDQDIKQLLSCVKHEGIEQFAREFWVKLGSALHFHVQVWLGGTNMGDKVLLTASDSDTHWDKATSMYGLLECISCYNFNNNKGELAKYLGGTVIEDETKLSWTARKKEIIKNVKVTA